MKKAFILLLTLSTILSARAQSEHAFEVNKNLEILNTLYRQLDLFYVDTLEADKLIRIGIDAMLEELDPYTTFYPEDNAKDLKFMTTGKYGGMGSYIRMRKDSTVIIQEPFAGSPAAEAGLKTGDVLLKLDDKDLKGMNSVEVSNLLLGEPGTTFVLRVQRPGEKKPREFKITRQSIKKSAVPYYELIDDAGYICLVEFTEGCAKELRKAVISLKEKGAKSIIIDVRNNSGGLLSEAVDIVNLFVPKSTSIVELRGKMPAACSKYITQNEPLDLNIPLAVLVNANTASSSEILAGALQDLDRAVIVGTDTYGKGLVQSPRDLPYNSSLKLTTAKYYIPSGRCIQAIDYKKERKAAEIYRQTGKKINVKDSLQHEVFHTSGGREVTEGSGIKPDLAVRHDTIANIVYYISRDGVDELTDWGTKYVQKHPTIPPVKDFAITDTDYEEFKKMLKDSGFKYDQMSEKRLKELKKVAEFEGYYEEAKDEFESLEKKLTHNIDRDMDRHQGDIYKLMAQEIIKRYYYQAGTVEESIKGDEDIKKAIEVLQSPETYNKLLDK